MVRGKGVGVVCDLRDDELAWFGFGACHGHGGEEGHDGQDYEGEFHFEVWFSI